MDSVLARPNVTLADMIRHIPSLQNFYDHLASNQAEAAEQAEISIKYDGYIQRERENAEKMIRLENIRFPHNMDFNSITSLSSEARVKLNKLRPETIGQASRISGVSPADISVLMVYLGR